VFLRSGEPDRPLVVARNLATSQCATFAVPPGAILSDLSDIVWTPEDLSPSGSSMMLLARCGDGYWRGNLGQPRLALRDHFPPAYSEVDLSSLGAFFPLHLHMRADVPAPCHLAHQWSPKDRCFHAVNLDVNGPARSLGHFQVFGVTAQAGEPPGQRPLRAMICNSFLITWQSDDQGHVTRIEGGYPVNLPFAAEHDPRVASVDALLGTAKCLSE
jgi:hypothetical protein